MASCRDRNIKIKDLIDAVLRNENLKFCNSGYKYSLSGTLWFKEDSCSLYISLSPDLLASLENLVPWLLEPTHQLWIQTE